MTRDETKRILQKISDAFPLMRNDMSAGLVDVWTESFQDAAFADVHRAVIRYIAFNLDKIPPSIGEIKSMLPARLTGDVVFTRAYDICFDANSGTQYIHKIRYEVDKHGDIVDEDGRIYASPVEEEQAMLVSRVRSTGMITTHAQAQAEHDALQRKLEIRKEKREESET